MTELLVLASSSYPKIGWVKSTIRLNGVPWIQCRCGARLGLLVVQQRHMCLDPKNELVDWSRVTSFSRQIASCSFCGLMSYQVSLAIFKFLKFSPLYAYCALFVQASYPDDNPSVTDVSSNEHNRLLYLSLGLLG